jgi:hypothetical protein
VHALCDVCAVPPPLHPWQTSLTPKNRKPTTPQALASFKSLKSVELSYNMLNTTAAQVGKVVAKMPALEVGRCWLLTCTTELLLAS